MPSTPEAPRKLGAGVPPIWKDMTEAYSDFFMEGFRKNWELQMALLTCKTPEEAMAVQTEMLHNAMAQYSHEMSRFYSLMTNAMSQTAIWAPGKRERAYNDVPV